MVTLLLALAALQANPAASPPYARNCWLVTPGSDAIRFTTLQETEADEDLVLIPGDDSVWPTRTLPGSRSVIAANPARDRQFAFGGGDGLVLELGPAPSHGPVRSATLRRREGRRVALPLAFGFCRQETGHSYIHRPVDMNADPAAIGVDLPAFDPRHWPERDCGLLLGNGRTTRLRLTDGANRMDLSSPSLWDGRTVTVATRWSNSGTAEFSRRNGPSGAEVAYVTGEGAPAVKLIEFQQIGDPAATGLRGYAICGTSHVVRRAA